MSEETVSGRARQNWWMWPARHGDWIRPGLRAATDADARRLQALPPIIGTAILPLAAILLPVLLSIGQATTAPSVQGDPYDVFAFLIYDVFTESIPFMLAAFAIGVMSPAAGVVVVIAYGIGNVVATMVTGELTPPLPALFGRFASCVLLWLLIVEIPLVGRLVVERWNERPGGGRRVRGVGVMAGALVVTALVQIWVLAAPLLIPVVFFLTSIWGTPFLRAVYSIAYSGHLIVIPAAVIAVVLLAVRYLGGDAALSVPEPREMRSAARRLVPYPVGLVMTFSLLSGILSQVVDGVILVGGLLFGRPLALAILRASGVASALVRIPWAIRLLMGAALAGAFSVGFIAIVGVSDISRWFNVVIATVASYVIVEVFLGADRLARRPSDVVNTGGTADEPTAGVVVTSAVAVLQLLAMALPMVASAHGWDGQLDINPVPAALAGAGAGVGAAMMMRGRGPRPESDQPSDSKPEDLLAARTAPAPNIPPIPGMTNPGGEPPKPPDPPKSASA